MNEEWRNELVTKGAAADAARDVYKRNTTAAISAMMAIKELPSVQETHDKRTETHACDLISRQAAIDALNKMKIYRPLDSDRYVISDCLNKIVNLPSAQPQRIKGRWERKESDLSWWYECSVCGESPLFDPYEHEVRSQFCPWCGARMEEEEDAVD